MSATKARSSQIMAWKALSCLLSRRSYNSVVHVVRTPLALIPFYVPLWQPFAAPHPRTHPPTAVAKSSLYGVRFRSRQVVFFHIFLVLVVQLWFFRLTVSWTSASSADSATTAAKTFNFSFELPKAERAADELFPPPRFLHPMLCLPAFVGESTQKVPTSDITSALCGKHSMDPAPKRSTYRNFFSISTFCGVRMPYNLRSCNCLFFAFPPIVTAHRVLVRAKL